MPETPEYHWLPRKAKWDATAVVHPSLWAHGRGISYQLAKGPAYNRTQYACFASYSCDDRLKDALKLQFGEWNEGVIKPGGLLSAQVFGSSQRAFSSDNARCLRSFLSNNGMELSAILCARQKFVPEVVQKSFDLNLSTIIERLGNAQKYISRRVY